MVALDYGLTVKEIKTVAKHPRAQGLTCAELIEFWCMLRARGVRAMQKRDPDPHG